MPLLTTTAIPPTEIYYEDVGRGRPVVLIHGWPLNGRMWEGQVNALLDAGYRCVTYDRRGFGNSGRPGGGFDYDTFSSDLRDVVTALDLQNAMLVGFSMGGGEVVRYLGRYGDDRVSRAMLVAAVPPFLLKTPDNAGGVEPSVFDDMIAGVKRDRIGFLSEFLKGFFNWEPGKPVPSEEAIVYVKSLAWIASPLATQQCITAFGTTDFRRDLAKIRIPVLVVHGDADRIVPLELSGRKAAAAIAGSRLEVLSGAPHGLTGTHGDELNRLMLGFLRS
jgi:pimeloyl-ACP methyl ester carboxylesterase